MTTWSNPVVEVIQRLNKNPERIQCLIELLAILPEEVKYRK